MSAPDLPVELSSPTATPKKIEVHLQKANFFRVVHVDGAWCSVNINKDIHMSLYSERFPLPQRIFFPADGGGGELIDERDTKKDWVREIEVDAVMSLSTARRVHTHLGLFIKLVEEMK